MMPHPKPTRLHLGGRVAALAALCWLMLASAAVATTAADGAGNRLTGFIGTPLLTPAQSATTVRLEGVVPGPFASLGASANGYALASAALDPDAAGGGEGEVEGEGEGDPDGEGTAEGEGTGEGEGAQEGEGDGETQVDPIHSADTSGDGAINLSELLRVIQFYNSTGYGCQDGTEDGYAPNDPDQDCAPHASDYNPQDWRITLTELLRLIQFYNSGGYYACPGQGTEDGYCVGLP